MSSLTRRVAAAASVGLLVLAGSREAWARPNAGRIHHQQSRLVQTQQELRRKKHDLQTVQLRVDDYARQLSETNENIRSVSVRLGSLSFRKRSGEERLARARRDLAGARLALQRGDAAYTQRLVHMYELGDDRYLEVLLGARSLADVVERWEDVRLMVLADQATIQREHEAERRVSVEEGRLEVARVSLERALETQEHARSELSALSDERRQLLVVASAQRAKVAQQVAELEELSAQEEAALRALIVAGERNGTSPIVASGSLSWPVRGPITSPFGWRMHPIYHRLILHEGIDIGADTGTPIRAANGGRVIVAGWVSGYGNYIAIDHGSGISTGYGHCSALFVAVGQTVQKGQVIGDVGSTGNSTGPHLHFEVRVKGVPVDPISRLSP